MAGINPRWGVIFAVALLASSCSKKTEKVAAPAGPPASSPATKEQFDAAVKEFQAVVGGASKPLMGYTADGDEKNLGGAVFAVSHTKVDDLIRDEQPRLLSKGVYLFRSEQHFGIGGDPDELALLPAIGDIDELERELRRSRKMYFWWD